MIQLTDTNFQEEVLKSSGLTLVDFWAPWCSPCKITEPIVEALAKEYEGRVKFTKMNVDEARETPSGFGIMSIPTFLFFKDGKVIEQLIGAQPKEVMRGKIEKYL